MGLPRGGFIQVLAALVAAARNFNRACAFLPWPLYTSIALRIRVEREGKGRGKKVQNVSAETM